MWTGTVQVWLMVVAAMIAGCSPPIADWESVDPGARIDVMNKAVREGDRSHLAEMVRSLENDDPLVRLTAGDALIRLTGKDFGYRYYETESKRAVAASRWRQWLAERQDSGNTSTLNPEHVGGGPHEEGRKTP